jgi:hypothetical protein
MIHRRPTSRCEFLEFCPRYWWFQLARYDNRHSLFLVRLTLTSLICYQKIRQIFHMAEHHLPYAHP